MRYAAPGGQVLGQKVSSAVHLAGLLPDGRVVLVRGGKDFGTTNPTVGVASAP